MSSEIIDRQAELLRGILASGECDWLTTEESHAVIFGIEAIKQHAALTAKYEAERAAREADAADARRYRYYRSRYTEDDEFGPGMSEAEVDALMDNAIAAIEGAPRG